MHVVALVWVAAFAPGGASDPADPADVATPRDDPNIHVELRVKSVNGVEGGRATAPVWPLDDVVLTAAGSRVDGNGDGAAVAGFAWELLEKPATSSVVLSGVDGRAEQGFAFFLKDRRVAGLDDAGDYRVRVTVTSSTGGSAHRDILVRVAWPGRKPPPPPELPLKPADDARDTMTLGAALGCCAGAGAAGAAAFAGLATISAGSGAPLALCGGLAFGPCSAAGSVVGAYTGAQEARVKFDDVSPWVLTGLVAEGVGASALLAGVGAATLATANPNGTRVDPNLAIIVAIAGGALVVLGGPATVLATFITGPAPDPTRWTAAAPRAPVPAPAATAPPPPTATATPPSR